MDKRQCQVLQVRWSKWQTRVNLDAGACLRKGNEVFLSCMITSHILSHPLLQLLCFLGLTIPSLQEVPLENWVGSFCAAAHPCPSQFFPLKVFKHLSCLVFLLPPDFPNLPFLSGSLLQQRSSLFQDHLLSKTSLYRNPFQWQSFPNSHFPHFSHFKSLCAETQHLISLLISGFLFFLY